MSKVSVTSSKGDAKSVQVSRKLNSSGFMGTVKQPPRPAYTPKRPGGTTGPKV